MFDVSRHANTRLFVLKSFKTQLKELLHTKKVSLTEELTTLDKIHIWGLSNIYDFKKMIYYAMSLRWRERRYMIYIWF